jgi:hypothetical protein
MAQANPKFIMDKPMLIVVELRNVGQSCIELQNYCIHNYQRGLHIIVSYNDHQFLVGDDFFIIIFSDLYDLFNLDALDISLMRCFVL